MPWLRQPYSLIHLALAALVLSCAVLPQQAQAQEVSIHDASGPESTESSPSVITFTVTLSFAATRDLEFSYETSPGTADSSDYDDKNGSVTIPMGALSGTFDIDTLEDKDREGDETFMVMIAIADGSDGSGLTFQSATATGTIHDDDDLDAVVSISSGRVYEGVNLIFLVSLDAVYPTSDLTFNWAHVGGTATIGADFRGPGGSTSGEVTISSGHLAAEIRITTVVDEDLEAPETVVLEVTIPPNPPGSILDTVRTDPSIARRSVGMGDTDRATGTIMDHPATVSIVAAQVTEGGILAYEIRLSERPGMPATVSWKAIDGTATLDTDLADNQETMGMVRFTADETTKQIMLMTRQDDLIEVNETLTVELTAASLSMGAGLHITDATAIGTIINDDKAMVSIDDATVGEGDDNAEFTVSLSPAATSDVTFDLTYAAGSADLATDLGSSPPDTVTFEEGDTQVTLVVPITDDDIVEREETFTVSISEDTLPDTVELEDGTATGTITDNDDAVVSISPVTVSEEEGETFTFTVNLSQKVSSPVTVRWVAAGTGSNPAGVGVGAAFSDLPEDQDPSSTVTFPANDTTAQEFTIATADDIFREGDETFEVKLIVDEDTPLPPSVTIDTDTATAIATIENGDDDTVSNSVRLVIPSNIVQFNEGDSIRGHVALQSAHRGVSFTVSLVATDGTATVVDDLEVQRVPITIERNVLFQFFTIRVTDDNLQEPDETFTLCVSLSGSSLPPGVTIDPLFDPCRTITILANDSSTVSISPTTVSAKEDETFTFRVTLSAALAAPLTVRWTATTAGGTGAAMLSGTDSDLASTQVLTDTVTFPANDITAQEFMIAINNDTEIERDEVFQVTIAGDGLPPEVALGTTMATATIQDDDTPTVSITPAEASVAEGGTFNFMVQLNQAVNEAITVTWTAAPGTGASPATLSDPGSDLGPNQDITGTAVFQAGTTTAVAVAITTTNDDIVEVAETFTVSLSGTLPGDAVYGTETATATITDTDSAVVSIGAAEVSEGGTLEFPVSLSAPVSREVTLTASTSDDTAEAIGPPRDYTSVTNGAIRFPANSVADVIFEVQTIDDRTPESVRETLTVTLNGTGLPERVTLSPTASTAIGSIVDNESVLVSIEDMQAAEGQGIVFPITFTVPLQLLTITGMRVTATDGTDAPAADLQADLGTWPVGVEIIDHDGGMLVTGGTYTVPTDEDNVVEGNETFRVTLGSPGTEEEGTTPRVNRRDAIGTIIDSDTARVSLTPTTTATEGDGTITFTVTLDNPVAEAFSLDWTATDGTATRATDFGAQSGTVDIPALSQSVTFTIDITDDEAFEEEETFTVAFSGAPTGLVHIDPDRITIDQSSATGTILDDDAIFVSIADASTVTEADNANAQFTVTLSRAAAEDVVLVLEYGEVSATPTDDLGADRPMTVTISEGAVSDTITVPIVNDDIVESEETFTVTLGEDDVNAPLPRGVFIEEGAGVGTGTITDDDMATVSIAPTEASATEGNPVNFTVQLSQAVGEAVTVTWTAAPGTGASPATLSGPGFDLGANQDITGTALFRAGSTTAVAVAITTTSDGVVEGAETFTVTLTSATPLPTGVTFGTQTATATITDSDMATVSITPAEASVAEGGTFNFMVQLNQGVDEALTVTWTAAPGTGASPATLSDPGSDLGPNQDITGTAFFPVGTTTAVAVAITTANDAIVEGAETFTVTLTSATPLPDGVMFGTPAIATITEDETATVSIAPAEISAAEEGEPFLFTVTLSREAGRAVVLDVGYAPGVTNPVTLADDLDSDRPDTVTIAVGELSASFTVPITDDDRVESDETFIVTLIAPDDLLGGVMIDDNNKSSTATITDSDAASISLTPASPSVAENESFTFTVTLSAPVSEDVNLTWTAREIEGEQAATIAIDLEESTDTLTIPEGSTNATFTIRPVDDDLAELDEIFEVQLTAVGELPDRVTLDPNARKSRATIRDDEDVIVLDAYPTNQTIRGEILRFIPSNIVSVGFSLVRGNTGNRPLIVNVVPRDGNTLTEGEDYRLLSTQIVVPAHTSTFNGSVGAQLIDDSVTEIFTESAIFDFEVASSHDARILNGIPADFTIEDGDRTTITLSQSASAVEGDMIVFTAELDNPVAKPFELIWTATDGPATVTPRADAATVADDLEDQSGTVTVSALSRTATISIPIVNDDALEEDENFTLTLTGTDGLDPTTDRFGIWPIRVPIDSNANSAVGTIIDNDRTTVSISPLNATAVEGGTFTFRVTLGEPVAEDVTVAWTAAGSGGNAATLTDPGSDLVGGQDISGTVTIRANTTTVQTITIATRNDTRDEGSETFTVTLSEPPATPLPSGVNLGTDSAVATATITDNNEATVSINNASVAENAGPARFTVSLSQAVSRDVVLGVTYAAGSADPVTDLGVDRPTTVTITASTTTATLVVPLNDDAIVEGTETFTVTIAEAPDTSLPDGVSIPATTAAGTGTITENDTATVLITQATTEAAEGSVFTFMAGLSTQVDEAVTVRWTAAPGTQTRHSPATVTGPESDLADGQSATGTVTFVANDTTPRQFTITTRNDTRDEGSEAFTVTLSADDDNPLPDGVSIPDDPTDAIITERESGNATVSIFPPTATQAEGNSFNFEVRLSRAAEEPVTVTWTAAGSGDNAATVLVGNGFDFADGQDLTGTLTFTAGDMEAKTITIATIDDDRVEGTETFTVRLTGSLPDEVEFATSRATATITEDDAAELSIESMATAAEGSPVEFAVSLNAVVSSRVVVRWTITSAAPDFGAATLSGGQKDLEGMLRLTGTVEFAADDNADQTISLATMNDIVVEGSETFTVTLSEDTFIGNRLPDGVSIPAATEAGIGTITEDDTAEVSIDAEADAMEGRPVIFRVRLSGLSQNAVTVRWTATTAGGNGSATLEGAGSDLTANHDLTGTVEFPPYVSRSIQIRLATVNDDRVEGSETFTVTLSPDDDNPLLSGVRIPEATEAGIGTITEDEMATVSLSPLSPSAAEGGTFTFTATLSVPVSESVTVRWTAASGTATVDGAGSDLASGQATTGTVEFAADSAANATQTFMIATNNDTLVEGSETFTVTLSPDTDNPLPGGVEISTDDEASATITEDDAATVSLSPLSPSAAEGGTFTFTATLSAPVPESVTVRWTAASGTATVDGAGSDLASGQAITGTVEFAANSAANATQTFTIATNNDTLVEGSETFTVTLEEDTEGGNDLPDGVEIGTDDEATATITEDETATVSLSPLSPSVAEGGTFTFTATLSAPASESVTVRWTAASGTATVDGAGSDLASGQAITGTVEFAASSAANATQTFMIATNNDTLVEGSETFTVTLSPDTDNPLPGGVEIGTDDEATAMITEDDAAELSIEPMATAAEGSSVEFAVSLSAAVSSRVPVHWAITSAAPDSGAATLSGISRDFASHQHLTGTVIFQANSVTQTLTIATENDTDVEGSETFTVTLSPDTDNPLPDGVSIPTATEAGIGTITEDETAEVSIDAEADAMEGRPVIFIVRLSKRSQNAVTVRWTATTAGGNGSATLEGAGSDLTANHDLTGTVEFPPYDSRSIRIMLATVNDDRVEGSETFTVTLSPDDDNPLPGGVTIPEATEAGTGTITEDDAATVSIDNASAAEGSAVTFTVSLSAASAVPVTVRWTATSAAPSAGAATLSGAGSDLVSTQDIEGTVVFDADDNADQAISFATVDDTLVEGSETFTVTLSPDTDNPLPGGVRIPEATEAGIGTITEDDAATVSLSPLSPLAAEGGMFTFTATLSASVSESVTVRWTAASGTATVDGAGSDLASGQATTGTVEFAANSAANATQTFTIATNNDTLVEGSETFTVTLSPDTDNPLPDGVEIGTDDDEATATITEDDAATVSLSPLSPSAAEGGTFTFTATLSASVSESVTVRWTAASGTATVDGAGSDLESGQAITGTVEFAADSAANATQTFTIATNNDTLVEGSETFTVTLEEDTEGGNDLPDGVEIGTDDEATATITEDDAATVSLSPLSPSAAEGETFTFTATLSAPVSESVTVRWTAASGTATVDGASSDLASGQATTGTVEFTADSAANAAQTFTIATNSDTLVEGSETFTVTLEEDTEGSNDLPDGVEVGTDNEATATITEDDAATVSLSPLSPSAAEGGTFTFTATLSASVSEAVTVRWTATTAGGAGTATVDGAGSDLASGQATTGTVEFAANSAANATQTFTIATNSDTLVEGSETFTVTLSEDTEGSNDLPDGVEIGTDDEATAMITEDDAATVSLSPLSPSVAEGGTFTFTATLSAPVSESVTVRWVAASGTATVDGAGSDLASGQATTGTVEFAADSAANATQTFMIATNNDTLVEGSETFTVTLSEDTEGSNDLPDGVEIGTNDEATATITEDETATVSLSPLSPSAAEGGTFTFTATLSASVSESVTVRWTAASGTATVDGAGSDLASGQATTSTIEFAANSAANATQTFTIATNNDTLVEGSETFTVTLSPDTDNPLPDGVEIGTDDDEATATITEDDAATVSLSPLSPSAVEGGTFTFTATLSASVSESVTVRWTAASGTATVEGAGSDLESGQAITGTVEFTADSAANATQTFTIATNNDTLVEGSETFTVTLSEDTEGGNDLPDGVEIGTDDDEATATITEGDAATVSIAATAMAAEGSTLAFAVNLSAPSSSSVTVRWTVTSAAPNAGAATLSGAGSDFVSAQDIEGTVVFEADDNAEQMISLATVNDDRVEGSETFTVTLSPDTDNPLPDGVSIPTATEAGIGTITEDETAEVSIESTATAAEGSPVEFAVSLSAASQNAVTVRWTATSAGGNGTATLSGANSDLGTGQVRTGTVVFAPDDTADKTVSLTTMEDTRVEGSETFTVTLSPDDDNPLPGGVRIPEATEAGIGTITEDDAATVSLSPLSPSAAEGGTFTFTATLSASVSEAVTVRWTAASGTATVDGAGSDLESGQAITGTVEFATDSAANATQTFTIATNNDTLVEGSETFTVTLEEDTEGGNDLPDGVEISTDDDEATATITEDDAATVSLSPLSPSVAEGGTFTFTATLSASVSEAVTVRWTAESGTATVDGAGSDLASGQATTGTVTFQADSAANATQTFTIATNNDALVEGSETFTMTLSEDTEGSNDLPDGVEVGTDDEATATITEDDAATVSLSPLSPSAAEGETFTFTATLSASVSEAVTVRWTAASGTATVDGAGSDLESGQATTGTVEFAADSAANATQTFTIATNNDTRVEGSETFTVTLSPDTDNPLPDGVEIGTDDDEATATITEDDAATVSLSPLSPSAVEGGTFTFTATLSASVSESVTVRWTAASGTATVEGAGSDLESGQAITGTVEFATDSAANATQTFTIATNNDTLVEGSETFTVTLSEDTEGGNDLPDGVEIGTDDDEATATITEGDAATVSIAATAMAAEGSTLAFAVNLSAPSSSSVTVRWTATSAAPNAGAATLSGTGSDFASTQDIEGTVVFEADDNAEQMISLATVNDDRVEGSETFTVTLSPDTDNPLPDGVSIPTATGAGIGTITEDETAEVSIESTATAAEGSPVEFAVSLSAASQNAVTVRWTATSAGGDGAATLSGANSDLGTGQVRTGTVMFAPDDTADKTVSLTTLEDTRVEGSETFTVTLSPDDDNPLPGGVDISDTLDAGTGTITEDDAATVSLSPLSPSAVEGEMFTFTATLSASVSEAVTVRWTAASGTATVDGAGSDLESGQAITGTVEFAADSAANATQTFMIATNNDTLVEGSETFTVTLSEDTEGGNDLPDGVEVGTDDEATATITEGDAATVSIAATAMAAEGSTLAFAVNLSAPSSSSVTVRWTATSAAPNAGAATLSGTGSDFASTQDIEGTVVFEADDNTEQMISLATVDDDRVEGAETFTVTLSPDTDNPLPDGVSIPTATEAGIGTITEDETAEVSIESTATAAEGSPVEFAVSLSAASQNAVTVRWTATSAGGDGAATLSGAGSDLTAGHVLTGTVVFATDDTVDKTVSLATMEDTRVEGSETFTVTLSPDDDNPLPGGVTIPEATGAGIGTITEDDAATVSLSPLSPSAAEGGMFTFTATLSASVSESVTVRWTAASGTATVDGAGSDLASGQAITGTVEFAADSAANATQTFMIATNNDTLVEGSETFTVTLSEDTEGGNDLPDEVEISTDDEASATITEDDAATVSLSPLSPSEAEGGTFTFTATLSASVSEAVTVRWTAASGTATVEGAGSDLESGQATTGTVEFAANSAANATQTFTIATNNDTLVEGSETFTVTLSEDTEGGNDLPDGVEIGTDDEATATITEGDAAAVSLSPLSPSEAEGGTFTFTATLSASVSEAVTVRWTAASGTATVDGAGSDLASGQATTGTVEFTADSAANATQTFTIATNNDTLVEGSETFTVTLEEDTEGGNDLPDGVEIGTDDEATATITEDDAAVLSIASEAEAAEGSPVVFAIDLSAASQNAVTVRWTATTAGGAGAATLEGADSDLTSGHVLTGTVEFTANDTASKTVSFETVGDTRVEGSETFTVTLSTDDDNPLPDGVSISPTERAGIGTITEDDAATVSLSPLSPSAAEGETFTFTVTLSASVSAPVTVRWTAASGTATVEGAGSDLASGQATTGTVEFTADSATNATQTFTIATNNDTLVEGSETFTVTLSPDTDNPLPGGVEIGTDDEATATITEGDAATVSLSPLSPSAAEGGTFTFTATLSASVSEAVTVRWTAASGTATVDGAGSDLASGQATTGTVEFTADSAANATQTFTIATNNDTLVEGSETFTVTLEEDTEGGNDLPDGVEIGTDDEATATITEDDAAVLSIASEAEAAEGSPVVFAIDLSAASQNAVTVRWTATTAGGAGAATLEGADSDLTSGHVLTGTVEFTANDTASKTVNFTTVDDTRVEGSETFTVTLSADDDNPLPDGVSISPTARAGTGTITEDDVADAVTVSLSPLSPSAAEGETFTFTVTLSASVSAPVTVRWTAASAIARVDGRNSDLAGGQATTGTVIFQANSTASQTFTIATRNDSVAEGPETFTVSIAADPDNALPPGVTIGDDDEARATITDAADATTLSLSPLSSSRAEGRTFSFTVTLNGSSSSPVTVGWRARASGSNPARLEGRRSDLADGQAISGRLVTFPANSPPGSRRAINIATRDDAIAEGDETFTVDILNDPARPLPTGVTIGGANRATATITDAADAATLSLSPLSPSAAEGETFTFTVALNRALSSPVTVRWTAASGTARVDGPNSDLADGQAATGTVTFQTGSTTSQTFAIATRDDAVAEDSETFTVSMAADPDNALPPGVSIGDANEATATITDEADAATLSLSPLSSSQAEGETFSFTVTLNGSSSSPVTVRWSARASGDNPATLEGADSDLAAGQVIGGTVVTFPANSPSGSTREIDIATLDDAVAEGDETFMVSMAADPDNALPPGVSIGEANEATATITDEADAATLSLSPLSPSAVEGGTFTFTVALNRASSSPVTVRWTAASGTARVDDPNSDLADGQAATGTVVFQASSTVSQTFTIATRDDAIAEDSETFTVSIAADPDNALPPRVGIGDANEATATITDEADAATVSLSPLSSSQVEGGTFSFTVALNRASSSPVTVRWTATTAGGDGAATLQGEDSDLADGQTDTGTVVFQAGSAAPQTFTIVTRDDTVEEDSETFTVSIAADPADPLPPWVTIGNDDEATATIEDDDEPVLSVLIEPRLTGAAAALRRHVNRFDSTTSMVIHNRLEGNKTGTLTASENLKDGALTTGGEFDNKRWGAWMGGSYARFNGDATGRQADIYGGVDYLDRDNNWLIGALIGYEPVDLDIGEATYEANYAHFGVYGGMRMSERLVFDGALSYGTATPDIALGNVSASYDANRFTVRGGLTGDFGLEYALGSGSITIEPQLKALYARESLGGFTDSIGGIAGRKVLELGRFSAGPRLTWDFNGGQLVGSTLIQWDFSDLDDRVDEKISGAADIGLRFELAPNVSLGLYADIDGIGITDNFITYGGRIELNVRF